ncbi:hypothetical protein IW136_004612 [Coemansia sp. RSA 678]|nr:hypothetical protein IW136_004612 [Coemansia sp. RSA 678]
MSDISHVEYSDLTQNLYASSLPLVLLDDNSEENTAIEGKCTMSDVEVTTSIEDEAMLIFEPESAIEGEDAMEDSQSEVSTIEEPEAKVVMQPEHCPSCAAARVSAAKMQEVFEIENTPIDNLIGNAAVSGPGLYQEAMSSNESAKWKDAVSTELESVDNNDVKSS